MGAEDDYLGFSITIALTGLALLLGIFILTTLQLGLLDVPNLPEEVKLIMTNVIQGIKAFDSLMILMVVTLFIITMIITYYLPANPLFFFVILLIGLISTMVTPLLTNLYIDVATHPLLLTTANEMPMTNAIMQNLPLIAFINMLINALVMYSKNPFQMGYGAEGLG